MHKFIKPPPAASTATCVRCVWLIGQLDTHCESKIIINESKESRTKTRLIIEKVTPRQWKIFSSLNRKIVIRLFKIFLIAVGMN